MDAIAGALSAILSHEMILWKALSTENGRIEKIRTWFPDDTME